MSTHYGKTRETPPGERAETPDHAPGLATQYAEQAHAAAVEYVKTCGAPSSDPAPSLLLYATAALVETPPDRATIPQLLRQAVDIVESLRGRYGDSVEAGDLVDRLRTRRSHGRSA